MEKTGKRGSLNRGEAVGNLRCVGKDAYPKVHEVAAKTPMDMGDTRMRS